MRINLLILASLVFSVAAKAEVPIWFVSVYGESMQLISGASAKADGVKDGVFLSIDFVGTVIYVRVQKGYELDGFRPYESTSSGDRVTGVSESTDASAQAAAPEEQSMDEFGPLSDTGLQYFLNDDYFGWNCSEMHVQPMGDGVYRLRCNEKMKHTN
jgi:hypothetical protein